MDVPASRSRPIGAQSRDLLQEMVFVFVCVCVCVWGGGGAGGGGLLEIQTEVKEGFLARLLKQESRHLQARSFRHFEKCFPDTCFEGTRAATW